ncbi:unnamed protein product [Sphagnum balticum]
MIEGYDAAAAASEFGSREIVTRSVVVGCFGSSSGTIAGFQNREAVQPGGVGHFFSRSGAADAGTTMPCDRQAEGQVDAASYGQEKSIVEKLPRETSKKNIHI